MHVEGLLQLIFQILDFLLLFEQFFLQQVYFALQIRDARRLLLGVNELALELFDFFDKFENVVDFLSVVDLSLLKR